MHFTTVICFNNIDRAPQAQTNERKEIFYLTTHSTHFIYGVSYMVKDHSDSERGNPLPPQRLLFPFWPHVWFQAVAGVRTYGTDSPAITSQPR